MNNRSVTVIVIFNVLKNGVIIKLVGDFYNLKFFIISARCFITQMYTWGSN